MRGASWQDDERARQTRRARELAQSRSWRELETQFRDRECGVRRAVLDLLLEFHYRGVDQLLVWGLVDDDPALRRLCWLHLQSRAPTALAELARGLRDVQRGPLCAALLATVAQGRQILAAHPNLAYRALCRALELRDIPRDSQVEAILWLGAYPGSEVEGRLARMLWHADGALRDAAARALRGRHSASAAGALLDYLLQQSYCDHDTIEWLGYQQDDRALRLLRRFVSWRGRLLLDAGQRAAARLALERWEQRYRHIPDQAVSRAAPRAPAPGPAAMSRGEPGHSAPGEEGV